MIIKRDNIGGWDGDSKSTHCASMRTLNTQVKKTGMRLGIEAHAFTLRIGAL